MLKFIIVAILVAITLLYSLVFFMPPSTTTTTTPTTSGPIALMKPNPIVQNDWNLQLRPNDSVSITLPHNESSTISTEVGDVGGIAGIGKGPIVVNITSGK